MKIKIKAEKQENGLWGTPISCYMIEETPDQENELLFSALLIALSEWWKSKTFKVYNISKHGFIVDILGRLYSIFYRNYFVIDYTLYEFKTGKERSRFLRKYKIGKLNEKTLHL